MTLRIILTLSIGSILNTLNAQTPVLHWQKTFGGSINDLATSIAPTADGGYIVAGSTGSIDGDVTNFHGGSDYWVVKMDASGTMQWQKTFGGSGLDGAQCIATAADGGYIVVGYTHSINGDVTNPHGDWDYWVVKMDATGNLQWQKTFGGSGFDYAFSIAPTADGGCIVAGYTNSTDGDVTNNHGDLDYWVVKMDATGTLQWQKTFGGSGTDKAISIALSTDGGYIVAGYTNSTDGDVTNNHGVDDYWVVKMDATGTLQWQKTFGGSNGDQAQSIVTTADGGYIVAGFAVSTDGDVTNTHGGWDYWVVKMDATGTLQWQKTFGGSNYDQAQSIATTADGGYIVAGFAASTDGDVTNAHGGWDYWVVKMNATGTLQWQKTFGGSDDDYSYSMATSTDGGYIVAGHTNSTDGDVTNNNGNNDYWVVKLTHDYNTIGGVVFGDLNSNGVLDTGETLVANHRLQLVDGTLPTWSGTNGTYLLNVLEQGTFEVEPDPLQHYVATPATYSTTFTGFLEADLLGDFALQPVGTVNDLFVSIAPSSPFRPGFDAQYVIYYTNYGTTSLAPTITLYLDDLLSFNTSSVAPTSVAVDSISWTLPLLNPLVNGSIVVNITVDPNAEIGNYITANATIAPRIGDATPLNNSNTWSVMVMGSYDPNDIHVDRTTLTVTEVLSEPDLNYMIRFQNTGTDTAFTVRIDNVVPEDLQFGSFQFVGSSHPAQIAYNASTNKLTFQFNNILLPDSNTNEMGSHGYVLYRIKPTSTLVLGDSILNQAAIYFDYNQPVITNVTHTVVDNTTGVYTAKDIAFSVYPNPAKGAILVQSELQGTLTLTDALGRELLVATMNSGLQTLNVNYLPSGLYFVTLQTHQGKYTQRLVLE